MRIHKLITILALAIYATNIALAASGDLSGTGADSTSQPSNSLYDKISTRSNFMQKLKERDQQALMELYNKSTSLDEVDLDKTQSEIEDITSQLSNISDEFTKISDQRQNINAKYDEIKTTMQQVVDQSTQTKATITDRVAKIKLYTKSYVELEKESETLKTEVEDVKAMLVRFATVLYRLNNEYYDDQMEIDEVKLLVKSDNIANTLSSEELIKILTFRFDQLIELMQAKQIELDKRQKMVDAFRVKYRDEVSKMNEEVELLNQQRQYLLDFLNLYRQDKIKLNDQIGNLSEDKQALLQDLRARIGKAHEASITDGSLTSKLNQTIDHIALDATNYLSWPVLPVYQVVGSYNDVAYRDYYGSDNLGVDISAAQFTPVYSPGPWVVHQVNNKDGIGLNWVVIAHPGGYTTLITSLNKIIVSEWQKIQRGQLLGSSGGEPGTRGAWFASPGPKVHFEVFKDGKAINPLSVIDLSVVQNRNTIPLEFEIKYLSDKASRKIDLTDVKIMPWNTLNERRSQYLAAYGFGDFGKLSLWQDAAAGHAVDMDMGICIATAESSMWRNLSSSWNVGNVGNNDRWDRIDLWGPLEWASLIFYALENEYLWNYPTIFNLSWYGNKKWAIYASSEINWQRNIMKCLTAIKGYRVPEEYPIRLMK
jgi:murein DD-endopeptidase MepM/ murein hydrolase activator NlpD